MKIILSALFLLIIATTSSGSAKDAIEKAILADGLTIEMFASNIYSARSIAVSDKGHVAIGSKERSVYVFEDVNGDASEFRMKKLNGFTAPSGVVWRNDDLIVGQRTNVLLFKDVISNMTKQEKPDVKIIIKGLINSSHHGYRFIDIGPFGDLYIALGAPCNICEPDKKELTAVIKVFNFENESFETYAKGLRNSVGFDWHLGTKELWATDNGRDWLGDESPMDELNRIHTKGLNFGFPYCHQGDLADPEFGKKYSCANFEPMAQGLGPHVASLGIHFVKNNNITKQGSALIALHGSWNRSTPIGYAIKQVIFSEDGTKVTSYEPFVKGWLDESGKHYARPVDIAELIDGSILISDDANNAIYRIKNK